ncbi:alpha/beta hydrolase [Brevibacillus sp. SYP-B805]|uniref:alpha/beta fold hydrolase n=1 Tax=Brevibacillus sp. SYP-B805 TaxID=1578199 RepID=UPI0013ED7485|nr:alpha/beta fold hydrolase [Brevibacillus sp. SYP-B805]NGQ93786.1 alpha/beta hydrolase [Brevibacillus sp. SYP-B805]
MMQSVKRFTYNGFTTEYFDLGPADAPAILFLHSIRSTKELFRLIMPAFLPQYRLIAADIRGHGGSSRQGPYTFAQVVEDLAHLLDHETIREIAIVAASFACVPAQLFAATYPQRVRKLVLLDGGFYNLGDLPGFRIDAQVRKYQQTVFSTLDDVHRAFARHHPGSTVPPAIAESEVEPDADGRYRFKLPVEALASYFQEYERFDRVALFSRLACPVLLLLSDEENMPLEEGKTFLRHAAADYLSRTRQARAVKIPGSQHLLMLSHPQETVSHTLRFLSE